MTAGPNGNIWFTDANGNRIGEITLTGHITTYPLPTAQAFPLGITDGPDGNLWFTECWTNKIGRLTPRGLIREYPVPAPYACPRNITAGPDAALWFTENDGIGKITTSGAITEYPVGKMPHPVAEGRDRNLTLEYQRYAYQEQPRSITAGPDGDIWFTQSFGSMIGKITPNGVMTEYPLPREPGRMPTDPYAIIAGRDGNLWFTDSRNALGKITPNGVVTIDAIPLVDGGFGPIFGGIMLGRGGNIWVTENDGLGRITPHGTVTQYVLPTNYAPPAEMTEDAHGDIWFSEDDPLNGKGGGRIGELTP